MIREALVQWLDSTSEPAPSAHALGEDLFGRHVGSADLASTRKATLAEVWADKAARPTRTGRPSTPGPPAQCGAENGWPPRCALLARRIANAAALDFLRWVQRGAVLLDSPDATTSLPQMLAIAERFADLPLDLADASIAEAAARLKLRHILSLDSDFDVYRDRQGRPLLNLLRP